MTLPLHKIILLACFYLLMIRGTGVNLFLPSSEIALNQIDYSFSKYLNLALLMGSLSYFFITNNYSLIVERILSPMFFIFLIVCALSIVFSVDKMQSIKFTIAVTAVSLPIVLYFYEYGTEALMREFSRFVIIISVLCLIYMLLFPQYAIMSGNHEGAWKGLFPHKNGSGPFFAIGFYFLLNQLQKSHFKYMAVLVPCMIICLLFVFMSKSSTAIICFLLMGILYVLMQVFYRFKNAGERLGLFFFGLSVFLLIGFFGVGHFNKILHEATGKDATLSGRTEIWEPLLDLSYERPLYGYGFGMAQRPEFMQQVHKYIDFEAQSSHNSYLDLILGIGYPGAILFLLIILKIFFSSLLFYADTSRVIQQRALFMALLLTMLIACFTTSYVLIGRSIFWVFLLMSLLCVAPRNVKEPS